MYIIYVKTIFRVYKKPYTGFIWSLGATNGINYWIFILGSGRVNPGRTQVRHWTHWLTQGLTLGQMVLSSWPDPIWPGQLGSGWRLTRCKTLIGSNEGSCTHDRWREGRQWYGEDRRVMGRRCLGLRKRTVTKCGSAGQSARQSAEID